MKQLWLSDRFRVLWEGCDPFEEVERLEGEVFRRVAARRTIRVAIDGRRYFAKIHYGVGWREIFKNLLRLKLPVLDAENEWKALDLLREMGLDTMTPVAFGRTGRNPARRRSFLITEELRNTISLEDLCAAWPSQPPAFRQRKTLNERLATVVRQMHTHGMNHRDCYLCHFHLDTSHTPDNSRFEIQDLKLAQPAELRLYVIDLHRAQVRRRTPRRWLIKDLAGLYFSALGLALTRTDRLRFIRAYEQKPLREVFRNRRRFWQCVERTAFALDRKVGRHRELSPV